MDGATRIAREIETIIRRLRPTSLRRGTISTVDPDKRGMGVRIGQDPEPTRVLCLDTLRDPRINEDVWLLEAGGANIAVARTAAEPGWFTPAFLNSWTNAFAESAPMSFKRADGLVIVRGAFLKGGINGTMVCVLPEEYRPGVGRAFSGTVSVTGGVFYPSLWQIFSNGEVWFNAHQNPTDWVTFGGWIYHAGD